MAQNIDSGAGYQIKRKMQILGSYGAPNFSGSLRDICCEYNFIFLSVVPS